MVGLLVLVPPTHQVEILEAFGRAGELHGIGKSKLSKPSDIPGMTWWLAIVPTCLLHLIAFLKTDTQQKKEIDKKTAWSVEFHFYMK
jgi:hypothetical protein